MIGGRQAREDPNVVTGTFLLNYHSASMLFDTSADRGFVSSKFCELLSISPTALENPYTIELANDKLVVVNHISKGCVLDLMCQTHDIDFMPTSLGSFDVVIGMDWLSKHNRLK